MYRRRQERRRRLAQTVIHWHPVIFLMIMFLLGACARERSSGIPAGSSAGSASAVTAAQLAAETSARQEDLVLITEAAGTGTESPASDVVQAMVEAEQSTEGQDSTETEPGEGTGIPVSQESSQETTAAGLAVTETGNYTSKEEVALYIHLYGHLPSNYISKRKAEDQGWDSRAGNLQDVLPGMSIGGSGFGNYEGLLPEEKGRRYYECDIDYAGGFRNAKRIIYSNDGLVFYTEDHYKTFEQLY